MTEQTVKMKVFRYNPETDQFPTYQTYTVPVTERMVVLQVLKAIYEDLDQTLAFRYYSCGYKFCNSCLMIINGRPRHACMTIVKPGDELLVEPYSGYPIIRDLVVDFGRRVITPDGALLLQRGTSVKRVVTK